MLYFKEFSASDVCMLYFQKVSDKCLYVILQNYVQFNWCISYFPIQSDLNETFRRIMNNYQITQIISKCWYYILFTFAYISCQKVCYKMLPRLSGSLGIQVRCCKYKRWFLRIFESSSQLLKSFQTDYFKLFENIKVDTKCQKMLNWFWRFWNYMIRQTNFIVVHQFG